MKKQWGISFVLLMFLAITCVQAELAAETKIPSCAWSRPVDAAGYKDGAPIGGFGAGTITWRYDGKFYNRLRIGSNDTSVITNCSFYTYQKTASGNVVFKKLDAESLGKEQATYHSLFPKSWVDYYGKDFPCHTVVTQFSPIIANDYQRTSYPVGVYKWDITNRTKEAVEAGIMCVWDNPTGGKVEGVEDQGVQYLVFRSSDAPSASRTEFALATKSTPAVSASYSSGDDVRVIENDFASHGILDNKTGKNPIGAIAFKIKLDPGQSSVVPIVLSWDIPSTIDAFDSPQKRYKRYTRFFGRSGKNSIGIAREAMNEYSSWEKSVDAWMNTVINNKLYPEWLKTVLFNELYYYFVGGTIWGNTAANDPDEDMFSHLESFKYPFYGTSDVRFYGSWPLVLYWPDIDKQCVRQFSDSITTTRKDRPKPIGTCAHDFGGVGTVFAKWNDYTFQDSTNWKDLNSKFVLMVYRDYVLTGKKDREFLTYCWPSIKKAMEKVKSQDTDGDGLPNSEGSDQTYDTMSLYENTAYCGGLFLAACEAGAELARIMGENEIGEKYSSWLKLGQESFQKELWTGAYYKIDTSKKGSRIMADQLCGNWYAKACGLPEILPSDNVRKSYMSIFNNNFKKFDEGQIGPVNVVFPDGEVDDSSEQTQEVWVGVAWAVAAGMVQEGLVKEAEDIGLSLYRTCWVNEKAQLWFNTPEAYRTEVSYTRAHYYMRANAVWALKHAYDLAAEQTTKKEKQGKSQKGKKQ